MPLKLEMLMDTSDVGRGTTRMSQSINEAMRNALTSVGALDAGVGEMFMRIEHAGPSSAAEVDALAEKMQKAAKSIGSVLEATEIAGVAPERVALKAPGIDVLVQQEVDKSKKLIENLMESFGDAYKDASTTIQQTFKKAVGVQEEAGSTAAEAEKEAVKQFTKAAEKDINDFLNKVTTSFSQLGHDLQRGLAEGAEIPDKVIDDYNTFTEILSSLRMAAQKVNVTIQETDFGAAAIQRSREAITGFRKTLSEAAQGLATVGKRSDTELGKVSKQFKDLRKTALQAGIEELRHNFEELDEALPDVALTTATGNQRSANAVFNETRKALTALKPELASIGDEYNSLAKASAALAKRIDFSRTLQKQGKSLTELAKDVRGSGGNFGELAVRLETFANKIPKGKAFDPLRDSIQELLAEARKAGLLTQFSDKIAELSEAVSAGRIKKMKDFRAELGRVIDESAQLGPELKPATDAARRFLESLSNVKDIQSAASYLAKLNSSFRETTNVENYTKEIERVGNEIAGLASAELPKLKKGIETLGTPKSKEDIAKFTSEVRKLLLSLDPEPAKKVSSAVEKLTGNLKKTSEGTKGLASGFEKSTTIASRLGAGFSDLQKRMSGFLITVGVAQSIRFFLQDIANAFMAVSTAVAEASKTQDLIRSFQSMSRYATGVTASFDKLREAASGLVPTAELVKQANLALVTGLPIDRFDELVEVGTKLGFVLGRDATDAVTRLTEGIAKQETELLDELGLYVRLKDVVNDTMTTAERKTAYFNAVMEQARDRVVSLSADVGENQRAFAEMTASLKDAKDSLSLILAPVITNLARSVAAVAKLFRRDFDDALTESMSTIADLTDEMSKYDEALKKLERLRELKNDLDDVNASFEDQDEATREAQTILHWFLVNLPAIAVLFGEDWKEGIEAATEAINEHNEAAEKMKEQQLLLARSELPEKFEETSKRIDFLSTAVGVYSKAVDELRANEKGLSRETAERLISIRQEADAYKGLESSFRDVAGPMKGYQELGAALAPWIEGHRLAVSDLDRVYQNLSTAYQTSVASGKAVLNNMREIYLIHNKNSEAAQELAKNFNEGGEIGRKALISMLKEFPDLIKYQDKLLEYYDLNYSANKEAEEQHKKLVDVVETLGLDYAGLLVKLRHDYPAVTHQLQEYLEMSKDINQSELSSKQMAEILAKARLALLKTEIDAKGIALDKTEALSKEELKLVDELAKAEEDAHKATLARIKAEHTEKIAELESERTANKQTTLDKIRIQEEYVKSLKQQQNELRAANLGNTQGAIDLQRTITKEETKLSDLRVKQAQDEMKQKYKVYKASLDSLSSLIEQSAERGAAISEIKPLIQAFPEEEVGASLDAFDAMMKKLEEKGVYTSGAIREAWRDTMISMLEDFEASLEKQADAKEKYADTIDQIDADITKQRFARIMAIEDANKRAAKTEAEIVALTNKLKYAKTQEAVDRIKDSLNSLVSEYDKVAARTEGIDARFNKAMVAAATASSRIRLATYDKEHNAIGRLKSEEAFDRKKEQLETIKDAVLRDKLLIELERARRAYLRKLHKDTIDDIRKAETLAELDRINERADDIKDVTVKENLKTEIQKRALDIMVSNTKKAIDEMEKLRAGELQKQLWRADKRFDRTKEDIEKEIRAYEKQLDNFKTDSDKRKEIEGEISSLREQLAKLETEREKEKQRIITEYRQKTLDDGLKFVEKYYTKTEQMAKDAVKAEFEAEEARLTARREELKAAEEATDEIQKLIDMLPKLKDIATVQITIEGLEERKEALAELGQLSREEAEKLRDEEIEAINEKYDKWLKLAKSQEEADQLHFRRLEEIKKVTEGIEEAEERSAKNRMDRVKRLQGILDQSIEIYGAVTGQAEQAGHLRSFLNDAFNYAASLYGMFGNVGIAVGLVLAGVKAIKQETKETTSLLEQDAEWYLEYSHYLREFHMAELKRLETLQEQDKAYRGLKFEAKDIYDRWKAAGATMQGILRDAITEGWENGWDTVDWDAVLRAAVKTAMIEAMAAEYARRIMDEMPPFPITLDFESWSDWLDTATTKLNEVIPDIEKTGEALQEGLESWQPETMQGVVAAPTAQTQEALQTVQKRPAAAPSLMTATADAKLSSISENSRRTADLLERLVSIAEEGGAVSIVVTPPEPTDSREQTVIEMPTERNFIPLLRRKELSRGRDRGFHRVR